MTINWQLNPEKPNHSSLHLIILEVIQPGIARLDRFLGT